MKITDSLLSAAALLEREENFQLIQDVRSVCQHFANPVFRIAVFAPFNHGKSTLLNALLGNRALPVKLIPTTGTAISIKHDRELHTRIVTSDGS
jgi:predicted GTPase